MMRIFVWFLALVGFLFGGYDGVAESHSSVDSSGSYLKAGDFESCKLDLLRGLK